MSQIAVSIVQRPRLMKPLIALLVVVITGCAAGHTGSAGQSAPAAPGATAETMRETAAAPDAERTSDADVRFMQGMMAHHAQALEMTSLVPERTSSADIRLLARRVEMSQLEEMEVMQGWLRGRGEAVPTRSDPHAHHHPAPGRDGEQHGLMPGMLTPEQLSRLGEATGPEFDRLFLQFMIQHHEGALAMVAALFEEGGGQDPEIFQFASHVDGDQRIEIARMHRMLAADG